MGAKHPFTKLAAAVLAAATLAACGASRTAGWERQQDRAEGNLAEVLADAEAAWLDRGDPASLEQAIAHYEQAIAINPNQTEVLVRLARANYFLADAYHRGDEEAQLKLYDQAVSWGERALATDKGFVEKVETQEVAIEDAIQGMSSEYAGAVYWSASALGKWARLKGFTTLLRHKGRVKKYMEWVTEVDPDFYYCGPDRYWGAYYSIAPGFAGGDMNKSKEHYEASMECEPNYLGTKVLMADTYATKQQDRELFNNLLTAVTEADPTVIPEIVPEQKAEQEKAKDLMNQADDLFALIQRTLLYAGL